MRKATQIESRTLAVMRILRQPIAVLLAVCAVLTACVQSADAITGSGATFPQQFQAWASTTFSRERGTVVLYANPGGGSSKGKSDFKAGLNDFGGTDSAVSESQAADFDWVYVPYVGGAIALAYRLDELNGATLSLSPRTLGGILSGDIQSWDDQQIANDMQRAAPWSNLQRTGEVKGVVALIQNVSTSLAEVAVLVDPSALRNLRGESISITDLATGVTVERLLETGESVVPLSVSSSSKFEVRLGAKSVAEFVRTPVRLPSRGITVVYRQDGSGTTNNLCKFLGAAVGDGWQVNDTFTSCISGGSSRVSAFGARFQGQSGSANLSNYVSNTNGSIGYMELSYALDRNRRKQGLDVAAIMNQAQKFVLPTARGASQLLAGSEMDDRGFVTFNYEQSDKKDAYPVVAVTYALARTERTPRNRLVGEYLRWILNEFAPSQASALGYSALSGSLLEQALKQAEKAGSL